MAKKLSHAATGHRPPAAPKFTPDQYGRAFLTVDPARVEHALGLALRSIRDRHAHATGDAEDLHDDLVAAAELAKVLVVANNPTVGAELGRSCPEQPVDQPSRRRGK